MGPPSHTRNKSEIQHILTNGTVPKHTPVEHVSIPSSPSVSGSSSARTSFQSHTRTISTATDMTNGRPNRFSVSFPVQPSDSRSSTPLISDKPDQPLASPLPTDTNFLTAIAASERKVLELKEELARAEADLNALKKQWAQHEAAKKREETRRLTKLKTLQTSANAAGGEDDTDGSNAWMQQEMERRKALMNGSRTSQRTVFSGSRHTRTLSLLSPGTMDGPFLRPAPPPRKDSLPKREVVIPEQQPPPKEDLDDPRDLKRIATDLKDGLWTFWEDLRQATVGEEATQVPPPHLRRQSSSQTVRTAKKQSSRNSLRQQQTATRKTSDQSLKKKKSGHALADPSFWTENGIPASSVTTPKKKTPAPNKSPLNPPSASSEPWDTWPDSPKDSHRSSSVLSETIDAGVSRSSSKRDSIPWPDLTRVGSATKTLRRTASHLVREWEKSLTPSPGQEVWSGEDYLGFDARVEQAAARAEAEALAAGVGFGVPAEKRD